MVTNILVATLEFETAKSDHAMVINEVSISTRSLALRLRAQGYIYIKQEWLELRDLVIVSTLL